MKLRNFLIMLFTVVLGFAYMAVAQDATPTPSPTASPLPLGGASSFLVGIAMWLDAHKAAIGTALGMVWIVVSKLFSTEKSAGIVDLMQRWLDGVANLVVGIGALLKKVSEFLAEILKSDGVAGKK